MLKKLKIISNNKLIEKLVLDDCLAFERHPKLTNQKIAKYTCGTRHAIDIFKTQVLSGLKPSQTPSFTKNIKKLVLDNSLTFNYHPEGPNKKIVELTLKTHFKTVFTAWSTWISLLLVFFTSIWLFYQMIILKNIQFCSKDASDLWLVTFVNDNLTWLLIIGPLSSWTICFCISITLRWVLAKRIKAFQSSLILITSFFFISSLSLSSSAIFFKYYFTKFRFEQDNNDIIYNNPMIGQLRRSLDLNEKTFWIQKNFQQIFGEMSTWSDIVDKKVLEFTPGLNQQLNHGITQTQELFKQDVAKIQQALITGEKDIPIEEISNLGQTPGWYQILGFIAVAAVIVSVIAVSYLLYSNYTSITDLNQKITELQNQIDHKSTEIDTNLKQTIVTSVKEELYPRIEAINENLNIKLTKNSSTLETYTKYELNNTKNKMEVYHTQMSADMKHCTRVMQDVSGLESRRIHDRLADNFRINRLATRIENLENQTGVYTFKELLDIITGYINQ
jgi:cell division protein FtsL